MYMIMFDLVLAVYVWRDVGKSAAIRGRTRTIGYQLAAVGVLAVVGCLVSLVAAIELPGRPLVLQLLMSFVLPLIAVVGTAYAVMWWAARLPQTDASVRREREAAEYNPFDDQAG